MSITVLLLWLLLSIVVAAAWAAWRSLDVWVRCSRCHSRWPTWQLEDDTELCPTCQAQRDHPDDPRW